MKYIKEVMTPIQIRHKIPAKEYLEQGIYPVIDQGQDFISGYTNNAEGVIKNLPVIVFGDHTRVFKYIDFPFVAGADGVKIFQAKPFFVPKLLFYFLQAITLPDRGYARHFQYLVKSKIPVPPVAEQKRIVKKIEELFSVIDTQVKQLEQTQKDLNTYRQSVLKKYLLSTKVRNYTFGQVIKQIIGGSTPSKSNIEFYQGTIPFMTVKDMICSRPKDTEWHITEDAIKNSNTNIVPPNTLIIATRVGLGKIVQMEKAVAINQDLKGLILHMELVSQQFFEYVLKYKTPEILNKSRGTTVKGITLEDFKNITFSLPSLPEQKAIVEKIETAFKAADKAQNAITNALHQAKQLKQSILKRAFEGKLVPQDPNDKPVDLSQLKKEKHK